MIKMRISGSVKCIEGSGVGLGVQTPESTEKSPSPEWWHVIAVLEPGRQRQAGAWDSRPVSEKIKSRAASERNGTRLTHKC